MEQAMALYVGATGDLRGLDYIHDAYLHDQALVYGASATGLRQERQLGPAYCDRIRGNYESGHDGLSAQSLTGLCRVISEVIDHYVAAQQSVELAAQRDLLDEEFARRLAEVAEALDAGTMEISDVPAAMGAPVDPIPAPLGVDCTSTGWGMVRFTNGGATWTGTYADGYNLKDRDASDVAETGTLSFRFDWATRTGTGSWGQPSIAREGTFPEATVSERDGRVEIAFVYDVTARGDQSLVSAPLSDVGQSGRGTITCPQ
jgi:hypothetical protein